MGDLFVIGQLLFAAALLLGSVYAFYLGGDCLTLDDCRGLGVALAYGTSLGLLGSLMIAINLARLL